MSRDLVDILAANVPGVARWAGAIARQLRGCDIVLGGKQSGVATTDALTLADDLPVAAHVARLLGGDAVWARTGRPIDFRTIWYDE